ALDMLGQGVSGRYSNVHPPLLSFVLGCCFGFFGSPAPILLVQLAALSGGTVLLLRGARRLPAVMLLFGFLCMPPVWSIGVTIWKDVAMAIALLWSIVALHRGRPLAPAGMAVLATTTRLNAITAVVPLVIPITAAIPTLTTSLAKRALAITTLVAMGFAAPSVTGRVFNAVDVWAASWVLTHDLMG